ncbi:MAG: hypothetical protein COT73_04980 [Bdellovibrio sp. CG10_big_fil_rev_8_21_14_0_10_47_8]|nr:MAG: hypothetical protein COT73_04980 [Bdellovibrio sp. CG10_big_fil_rev_8_21_14_0_10_47_8]
MYALILPFHSDVERLDKTLALLQEQGRTWQIEQVLLCHNGPMWSEEKRQQITQKMPAGVELYHTDDKGIGAGYKLGIKNAKSPYCVLSASDLPFGFTDIQSLEKIFSQSGQRPELAIGSKAHPASRIAGYGLKRRVVSMGFWFLRALMLGWKTPKDSQGTILIQTELAQKMIRWSEYDNYFFSVELISLAQKAGAKAVELPVVLENHEGESSVSLLGDSLKLAKALWTFSRRLHRMRVSDLK